MTNNIVKLFQSSEVRFVDHLDGKYQFGMVAEDLASVLEHTNSRALSDTVEEDWKGVSIVYTLGGV